MKLNLPVTQVNYELPDGETLVSTTDTTGRITHCNQSFVNASGFDYDELLGQPHDIVRHPDVPPEAFKDLWATIGRGRPWTGIVKNRRKNGDHYWVVANVTPVMVNGKPKAYMSVRLKPTPEQIRAAEALYAQIAAERSQPKPRFKLHAGGIRGTGLSDFPMRRHRLTLMQRVTGMLGTVLALVLAPLWLGLPMAGAWQAGLAVLGVAAFLAWFKVRIDTPLAKAEDFSNALAGCALDQKLEHDPHNPLGIMMRNLWLTGLNMRAIVTDVRAEVQGMASATQDIHRGSVELSAHTDSQAAGVEETSAAADEITGTVAQTAETALSLSALSTQTSGVAERGGRSVEDVAQSMQRIQASSGRITDIIEVIEKIAFQTNLLALNAAVEASHAGEHGRGFGVVASEVRALARRSSDAAQQIRDLIRASGQEVEQGSATVDSAAATIRHTVESVLQVTTQLEEITQATREQALGVTQISEAMHDLDRVTQRNQALAQESATACEALNKRAATLQRAVQVFRLTD
jgi:aerotaxis receptor